MLGRRANPGSPYRGYRFPPEVIAHAVWLYFRFHLSFRDVEELLSSTRVDPGHVIHEPSERGIPADHTTIWRWVQCYAPELNNDAAGS